MKLSAVNTFSTRYEVLRDNAFVAQIYAANYSPEIQNIGSSELKMSLRGQFYHYESVNFLSDRLRPIMIINGEEYPLGVFVVTTETDISVGGIRMTEIEAYSVLYLAQRKRIEERLSIRAGENYITRIVSLLNSCGINDIDADPSEFVFASAREDWDIGTSVLEIVNQLLDEISYNPAWVDLKGAVRLTKYVVPTIEQIQHTYSEGEYSVIASDYSRTTDRYGKYNVFRVTCENPDLEEPMVAIAENNSPDSPFSTVNIGRVLFIEQVDNIPSQAALQDYAERLRNQSMQETETVEFYTALSPDHAAYDVIALNNGELAGIYTETEWRLPMSPSARMTHKARRLYAG